MIRITVGCRGSRRWNIIGIEGIHYRRRGSVIDGQPHINGPGGESEPGKQTEPEAQKRPSPEPVGVCDRGHGKQEGRQENEEKSFDHFHFFLSG